MTTLQPMAHVLANRNQNLSQDPTKTQIAPQNDISAEESKFEDVMHTCPVMINGVMMPFPLYSEKIVAESSPKQEL
jgi:hypothetical protein